MSERQWIFPIESKIDAILPDGTHRYWSIHCRHDNHEACSADTISGRPLGDDARWLPTPVEVERKPAQCKACAAPCICPCHAPERVEALRSDSGRSAGTQEETDDKS